MIPAGHGGNLADYLQSLRRLAESQPARALPGHGPVIDDPVALIGRYIAHRLERERQVVECLKRGVSDADAIVREIYPALASSLIPAARVTIQAHLDKIRQSG